MSFTSQWNWGKKFQKGINNLIHNIVLQLTVLLFLNLHKWSLHCLPFCNFSFLPKIFVISLYLWIKMDPFISNCFHWSYNYHFKYPLNFFQFFYYSKQFCNGHSCSCLCAYIWGRYGSVLIDDWLIAGVVLTQKQKIDLIYLYHICKLCLEVFL